MISKEWVPMAWVIVFGSLTQSITGHDAKDAFVAFFGSNGFFEDLFIDKFFWESIISKIN